MKKNEFGITLEKGRFLIFELYICILKKVYLGPTNEPFEIDLIEPLETASLGQRFLNHIIDIIVFYILSVLVILLISSFVGTDWIMNEDNVFNKLNQYFILISIYTIYYSTMEYKFGKTIGKFITKTKVVTENSLPPTYNTCFFRSIVRIIPFEPISILFDQTQAWHDRWTKTYVVKEPKVKL